MQKRNCILVLKHLFMGERRVQGTLLTERKSKVKMSHQTREKARFRDQETRSLNLVFKCKDSCPYQETHKEKDQECQPEFQANRTQLISLSTQKSHGGPGTLLGT